MAPKRASPLDEPPTASSSEEEEEVSSSEEEGGSSSEEDEAPAQTAKPSSSLPPPTLERKSTSKKDSTSTTPQPQPQPQPSSSESESDSGSETEDDHPIAATDSKVKPIASKPMEEAPKKNSKLQPSATPSRSGTKRPNENNRPGSGVKKAKGTDTASNNEVPAAEDGGKKVDSKKLFQRLWSEDDELVILNGMNEFRVKNGVDPYKNMDAFHDFIKESLHVDVSRSQLTDKIWRLKKKHQKNATRGKNGEDPKFTKLHDKKVYELSKKIWGSEGTNRGVEHDKSNGKARNSKKGGSSKNVASPQAQLSLSPHSKGVEKTDVDQNSGSILSLNQMIKYSGLNEDVIRRGFESVEALKKTEFEEKWKNLQLLELEFFVKRAELIRDHSKLVLEAYRSSNH